MTKRLVRAAQAAGLSVLAAAVATTGVSAARPASHPQATMYTLTVGTSVPLSSGLKDLALGIDQSVQLAVLLANKHPELKNVRFATRLLDDTVGTNYSPDKDAANGRTLIADPTVIGEVGPLNSAAAQASMPVYNEGSLVQISPANTNPGLTDPANLSKYQPATAASQSPRTYFRTCTTDAYQGLAGARYAADVAHFKSVYVTDNKDTYGVGLAGVFKANASKLGMKVLGYGELEPNQTQMGARPLATVIKNTTGGNVDLVYFGGEYGPSGGAEFLARALRQEGMSKVAFMGGDGIYDPAFIASATPAVVNNLAYATSVGFPPSTSLPQVPQATRTFVKQFAAQHHGAPIAGYDYEAFDAANVIIRAAILAVKHGQLRLGATSASAVKANREAIARNVAHTSDFVGATGQFTFDKNGDTSARIISVYKVVGGQWQFEGFAPGFGTK